MRFTSAIIAAVALASSALAQTAGFAVMTSPSQDQQVPAGTTLELIWTPGTPTGPITIALLQGETAGTLQIGATLATGVPSTVGKFSYTVPSTAAAFKTYGFKITLDSDTNIFQYSFPFHVSGGSSSSSSSSSSATGSVTTAGTTSSSSSLVTGITTSVPVPTTSANTTTIATSTVCPKCNHNGTSSAIPTSTASVPSGNSTTLLTSGSGSPTKTSDGTTGGSTTTSKPSIVPSNAAMAKAASAGLALGGMIMAFAL